MDEDYYRGIAKSIRLHKRLGQNFLLSRRIAAAEAAHCAGKNVLELGPGLGILTEELCAVAKSVISIEIDPDLYEFLESTASHSNLKLIKADFFSVDPAKLKGIDILASNVPYHLSSRLLLWLVERKLPAVLCLQKEFVDRMLAKAGTEDYSRLSVFCSLRFSATRLMKVPSSCFYPVPRVQSSLVYLKPKAAGITKKEMEIISLVMEHKNKKMRNAVEDSAASLGLDKPAARKIADSMECSGMRASKMEPLQLLDAAKRLSKML